MLKYNVETFVIEGSVGKYIVRAVNLSKQRAATVRDSFAANGDITRIVPAGALPEVVHGYAIMNDNLKFLKMFTDATVDQNVMEGMCAALEDALVEFRDASSRKI